MSQWDIDDLIEGFSEELKSALLIAMMIFYEEENSFDNYLWL
jgi:hypothetical protein